MSTTLGLVFFYPSQRMLDGWQDKGFRTPSIITCVFEADSLADLWWEERKFWVALEVYLRLLVHVYLQVEG